MLRKIIISFLIIVSGYSSCKLIPKVNCNECTESIPDSADIKILFTINKENPKVPLIIYRGKAEQNEIDWIDTTDNETLYLFVKMDQYYSVVAKYKSGSRTILAVDGSKITTQYVTDACNFNCYIVTDNILDVRLKE